MADVRCPACGEADDLAGSRVGELIVIACGACGHAWERDPRPSCDRCGGTDMRPVPKAVMEKVRGNQRTMIATVTVAMCASCDRAAIARFQQSRTPLPPDEPPPVRGG